MSQSIYMGCYVQLPKVKKVKKYSVNVCSNNACPQHASSVTSELKGKFCQHCGSAIKQELVERESTEFLTLYDLQNKSKEVGELVINWNDEFMQVDPENYNGIIMSNKTGFIKSIKDNQMLTISDVDIKEEIRKLEFYLTSKGVLGFLVNHYGFNPEIKYGIASYYY